MSETNTAVFFKARPAGLPVPDETFEVKTGLPMPKVERDGDVLVRNINLSLDPAMRGWMRDGQQSYTKPLGIGELMRGFCVSQVIESRSPQFQPGDFLTTQSGWTKFAVFNAAEGFAGFNVALPKPLPANVTLEAYNSILGLTGLTAIAGIYECGKAKEGLLKPGDTAVVSGALGATGMVAAQIYKHVLGCRVVGIAGGKAKCDMLVKELGLDAAVDYKAADFPSQLAAACPNGISEYFDNVEGTVTECVFENMARGCYVISCGGISNYNDSEPATGPKNYRLIRVKQATVRGFIVTYFAEKLPAYRAQLTQLLSEGKIKNLCTIVPGLENSPKTFLKLFDGGNTGKLLVSISEPV